MRYVIFEPTPQPAVEYIQSYILHKNVFDLGAGDCSWAFAMSKYAHHVTAVEIDWDLAKFGHESYGHKIFVQSGNFLHTPIKEAQVIFIFLNQLGNYAITRKIKKEKWHGTIISHYYPLHNGLQPIKPHKIIHVDLVDHLFPFLVYKI